MKLVDWIMDSFHYIKGLDPRLNLMTLKHFIIIGFMLGGCGINLGLHPYPYYCKGLVGKLNILLIEPHILLTWRGR